MFNPADLPVVPSESLGSFVGVKNNSEGKTQFYLPIGFDTFPSKDTKQVNRLFFSLYKVFRQFSQPENHNLNYATRNYRDSGISASQGFSFEHKEEGTVSLYSKIPMIEKIIETYNELKIFSIINHEINADEIEYSKLHMYLEKAIYTHENCAYIDRMVLPKQAIRYSVTDIVRMYCYIYCELKIILEENDDLIGEITAQALIFKEHFLRSDSGLFNTDSHESTIRDLKNVLYEIDRQVTLKDSDYYDFFDVIDSFLHGESSNDESGIHWGIDKFSPIWEDMCLTWMFQHNRSEIVYADTWREHNINVGGHPLFIDNTFSNPFYLEWQGTKRHMRPDLVRNAKISQDEHLKQIIDIQQIDLLSYHIRLKLKDKPNRLLFKQLAKKLAANGSRNPADDATSHTFRGVYPHQFQKAISEIKSNLPFAGTDFLIVDFKYVTIKTYYTASNSKKLLSDVKKQLVYELALKINTESTVSSQLYTPRYFTHKVNNEIGELADTSKLSPLLTRNKIVVFEVDFMQMMNNYINTKNNNG